MPIGRHVDSINASLLSHSGYLLRLRQCCPLLYPILSAINSTPDWIAFSNLRSCLEIIVSAHIVENIPAEAEKFLKREKVEPVKIQSFIPMQYNDAIKDIKEKLGAWGVHSHVDSIRLAILCGPSLLDKMIAKTKIEKEQALHDSFIEEAKVCVKAIDSVFTLFIFLITKGTKYRRTNPI